MKIQPTIIFIDEIGKSNTSRSISLLDYLAPCQWGSCSDSHLHKLMVNYNMMN